MQHMIYAKRGKRLNVMGALLASDKMKYVWLDFKTRDALILEADIDKILDGFGGPD